MASAPICPASAGHSATRHARARHVKPGASGVHSQEYRRAVRPPARFPHRRRGGVGQGRGAGRSPIAAPHASPVLFSPQSLSELREYTEGLGEPAGADDCAPPAAGQSVISLLSSKELQQLIEEVRVLDEATLKVGVSGGRCGSRAWLHAVRSPPWAGARAPRLLGAGEGGRQPGVGSSWWAAGRWTVRPSWDGVSQLLKCFQPLAYLLSVRKVRLSGSCCFLSGGPPA